MTQSSRILPADLTSADLLKALAVILMIADHVGYYLYPDVLWLRIAGRLSIPVWFFLIGYAGTRPVPDRWWIGGGILVLATLVGGQYLFPLNILFTLALTRLCIARVMAAALRGPEAFAGMALLLFFLSFPTAVILEYGTLGLLFAMLGYLRANKGEIVIKPKMMAGFMVWLAVCASMMILIKMPALSLLQFVLFEIGLTAVLGILFCYRPQVYPGFRRFGGLFLPVLRLLGRRTLEIYVLHVLILLAAGMVLDPDRFPVLEFGWIHPSVTSLFLVR